MEKELIKGNEALAEAAIRAGCRHFFGYPITPQTEINAHMAKRMPQVGGVYLQAESELAAINMLLGASAAGARAMTSSSSPGISLKTEGISYIAASDLPCLIVNVQRGGPGLGGIQPSQADYFQATKAPGHGDLHIIVLAPSTAQEMADHVYRAFELAERYRMPAMILADGMLGQMMEPVVFPDRDLPHPEKDWALTSTKGQRDKRIINSLHLDPYELEQTVLDRYARYAEIERDCTESEIYLTEDAEIVLVAYGASARIARSAIDMARERGIRAGLLRPVTLWPFPKKQIQVVAQSAKQLLVVEMSMGQMVEDVRLAVNGRIPVAFFGRTGGVVFTPEEVLSQIEKLCEGGSNA